MSEESLSLIPQPRLRLRRQLAKNSESGTGDSAGTHQELTKFGAVRVVATVLCQSVDSKTYVITNKTTCSDLVKIVISGYSVICADPGLFYVTLERKHRGTYDSANFVKIQDSDGLLELQSRYPRGETRFCLHVKPDTGVITVRDKCIHPHRSTHTVYITKETTSRRVLELVIETHKCLKNPDDFRLHSVDSTAKGGSELSPSDLPLSTQSEWVERHECYFDIRPKGERKVKDKLIRRSRSLEETPVNNKKLLNIREVRRHIHQTSQRRKPRGPEEALSSSSKPYLEDPAPASRLRESLTQLRDHLDTVHARRSNDLAKEDPISGRGRGRSRSLSTDSGPDGRVGIRRSGRRRDSDSSDDQSLTDSLISPRKVTSRSDISDSTDNLSAWEKRKMYDMQRRQSGSTDNTGGLTVDDVITRSRKSSASSSSSKSRTNRRSLPTIPGAGLTNGDIADRKTAAAKRAKDKIRNNPDTTSDISMARDVDSEPSSRVGSDINIDSIEESVNNNNKVWDAPHESGFKPLHPHPITEPVQDTKRLSDLANIDVQNSSDFSPPDSNRVSQSDVDEPPRITLHAVLKLFDLHHVTLTSQEQFPGRSLTLFESVVPGLNVSRTSSPLSSPSAKFTYGKRPILGQNGSAFVRVNSCPESSSVHSPNADNRTLTTMSTVRSVDRSVVREAEGSILEGDHIVEIGGVQVLSNSLHDIRVRIGQLRGPLEMVVARPRQPRTPERATASDRQVLLKDLEKCKIRYESSLRETELYMDMLADLRLEVQAKDGHIRALQQDLDHCRGQLLVDDHRKISPSDKDNKIFHQMLVHQDEFFGMTAPITKTEYKDYDYDGAHVSAV